MTFAACEWSVKVAENCTVPKIGWEFDLVGIHSESKGSYTFQSFLTDRLTESLNVVSNRSGGFNCVNPANGCVAAPALTPAVIAGQLPQAWVNANFVPVTGISKYKEDTVAASVTGKIVDLPYGKLKGAFGVEMRQYSIDDTPEDRFFKSPFSAPLAPRTRPSPRVSGL